MKFYLYSISALVLVMYSCGTSNKYFADDVYVLKPNELPIGESSADETSYAAFKKRKDGPVQSERQMYADQYFQSSYRNCLAQPFWFNGCGCSYATWTQHSPYSPYYGSIMYGPYQGFGYGFGSHNYMYSAVYYSPDFGMFIGSPFYNPYNGTYYSPYGYGYGLSGYGGYGYGGNGYYSNNHNSNYFNGPRGSAAGFSNPNGRQSYAGPIKSGKVNSSGNGHSASSMNKQSAPVHRPISTINTTPNYRTTTTSTVQRNSGTTSQSSSTPQGRTYQKASTPPTRTYTPSVTRTPSSTPAQRQNSGQTIQRSGSSNSGSSGGATRSSGGNSTPRSTPNTGRRP